MSEPRYLLTAIARACVARGISTYQFDYPGQADSIATGHASSFAGYLSAANGVCDLARASGAASLAVIGYGLGNRVAASLLQRDDIVSCALIFPRLLACGAAIHDSRAVCDERWYYPQVADSGRDIGLIWEALVGEKIVPSQCPAPLPRHIVGQAMGLDVAAAAARFRDRVLVVSDDRRDDVGGAFSAVCHEPSPERPSWHWAADKRAEVVDRAVEWISAVPPEHRPGAGSAQALSRSACGRRLVDVSTAEGPMLGVLQEPSVPSARRVCVVYEPGIPGQRVDVHGCGGRLAERLARSGIFSFRYDGRGCGLSDGGFERVTWSRRIAEHERVLDFLREEFRIHEFVVVGNSAGARLAVTSAGRRDDVTGVVLWGPIFIEPSQRTGRGRVVRHGSGLLVTEYCGLWLGIEYNLDERRHDFLGAFQRLTKPGLIIFGDAEQNQENERTVRRACDAMTGMKVETASGDHGFSPVAVERVLDRTVDWIQELAHGGGNPAH